MSRRHRWILAILLVLGLAAALTLSTDPGRANLGSDIMIHGTRASVGCLAMGNETAETLFVLASHAGLPNIRVIIAPTDFRRPGAMVNVQGPPWLGDLCGRITTALREFPATR